MSNKQKRVLEEEDSEKEFEEGEIEIEEGEIEIEDLIISPDLTHEKRLTSGDAAVESLSQMQTNLITIS